jgi:hypothetical protein
MGDVADAMLDGDLCQCCGVYMEGGAGYPQTCNACQRNNAEAAQRVVRPMVAKVACPTCGKKVKAAGLADHQRDAHGSAAIKETKP